MEYISKSVKETLKIASVIASGSKKGEVVLLYGDLGAGKTVFCKGFVKNFSKKEVTSPTFTIVNTYEGKMPIYHFDLYRLNSPEELENIGFNEYVYGDGICLIEWPERAGEFLPEKVTKVIITKLNETSRKIELIRG